jgi:hypothetical protein
MKWSFITFVIMAGCCLATSAQCTKSTNTRLCTTRRSEKKSLGIATHVLMVGVPVKIGDRGLCVRGWGRFLLRPVSRAITACKADFAVS